MPKLEANLQFMFNEFPVLERYDMAAQLGFKGVEIQSPYGISIEDIVYRLNKNNLKHVIINTPVSDPDTGMNNISLRPDRKKIYRNRTAMAIEYAHGLKCDGVNIGIGQAPDNFSKEEINETLLENILFASDELKKIGVKALLEPINVLDQPGFFVNTSKSAINIINRLNHPNLFLLYDFYHMQIMEGDLARTVSENLNLIGHIQIADNPGRNQPGTGEINYSFILQYLDKIGYENWVGCEYYPTKTTQESLSWADIWL
ncbi:MAG: hydroxypyruvate isomerase [Chloroflexi bacterium]|nr:hydroxypyruvate isomerase [Chloroflexota bacterium]|tara:strand:- start:66 stop:842 length:777 start_codon:yes stop_codon:yes gene_type:complete